MTELVNKDISEQYYIDRDGNQVPIPVSNNALIEKMFAHTMTRGIMKMGRPRGTRIFSVRS